MSGYIPPGLHRLGKDNAAMVGGQRLFDKNDAPADFDSPVDDVVNEANVRRSEPFRRKIVPWPISTALLMPS